MTQAYEEFRNLFEDLVNQGMTLTEIARAIGATSTSEVAKLKMTLNIIKKFENCSEIGARVLVRSNEPDALMEGVIARFGEGNMSKFPIVHLDNGKDLLAMGRVVAFSQELKDRLLTMKWWEQYNYLVGDPDYYISEQTAHKKEKYHADMAKRPGGGRFKC